MPESLREDEIRLTVYSLFNTIKNKISNYNNIEHSINSNDTRTYRTDIISCNCANFKSPSWAYSKCRFTDNEK